jgi:hypothetical protein
MRLQVIEGGSQTPSDKIRSPSQEAHLFALFEEVVAGAATVLVANLPLKQRAMLLDMLERHELQDRWVLTLTVYPKGTRPDEL